MPRHLLSIADLTREEVLALLSHAAGLKKARHKKKRHLPLVGKTLGMIFEKASTRTRVSFEAGMAQLGGHAIFLSPRDIQMGRGEPIKDTARVLSRYVDALLIRTFGHEIAEEMAAYSDVPVINGLTDRLHPCQVLADLQTIVERFGDADQPVAYLGDGNNMANSWINAAAVLGFPLVVACPEGHGPDGEVLTWAKSQAGANIRVTADPREAARGARVLNTDVWVSMGQEGTKDDQLASFEPFRINRELVGLAADDVIVMHCLPAHRGEEITEEVLEGSHSVVFDEAENRLHVQKAVLEWLITGEMGPV